MVTVASLRAMASAARSVATGLAIKRGAPTDFHAPLPSRAELGLEPAAGEAEAAAGQALDGGAADERLRTGASLGPLDGVPVSVKANISIEGLRVSARAQILADHSAPDAELAGRLRRAGAVLLATANLSELAGAVCRTSGTSEVGGKTMNPFGADFTPGGSSSGSAASVAAGLVPLIRFQDSAGPIAGSVAEAALLLDVMSGGSTVPQHVEALAEVRIGVLRSRTCTPTTWPTHASGCRSVRTCWRPRW